VRRFGETHAKSLAYALAHRGAYAGANRMSGTGICAKWRGGIPEANLEARTLPSTGCTSRTCLPGSRTFPGDESVENHPRMHGELVHRMLDKGESTKCGGGVLIEGARVQWGSKQATGRMVAVLAQRSDMPIGWQQLWMCRR